MNEPYFHPSTDPASSPETPASPPADWKVQLRQEFEAWLQSAPDMPDAEEIGETDETDLNSLLEHLSILSSETRRANRRTAEAIGQWTDLLSSVKTDVSELRTAATEPRSAGPGPLPRPLCLGLVEMMDRVERLLQAAGIPPAKSWWPGQKPWQQAWSSLHDALDILHSHLGALLQQSGIIRLHTAGKPFDPTTMTAVAIDPNAAHPQQQVVEDLLPGYLHNGDILRLAQVKVSRPASTSLP